MKVLTRGHASMVLLFVTLLSAVSCSAQKPADHATQPSAPPTTSDASALGATIVTVKPGEAGGVIQETFTASAAVTAIDAPTRQVTLKASDGHQATFIAGPEVRNFDQLKVGDTITATVSQKLVVFVQSNGGPPTATHAAALASAPLGAKPGVLAGRGFELTATIKAIDSANRTADLQFVDGSIKTVPIRPDVDLTQYKVSDTVVIQVTQTLSILAETP